MKTKKISILGLGYIGLPTALVLADSGYLVNGFDIDKQIVDQLNRGKLPFSENGLDELFKKERVKNNFIASSSLHSADIYLVAVPTPISFDNEIPKAITKFVEIAALSMSVQNMLVTCYVNNITSYWRTATLKDDYAKNLGLNIKQKSLAFSFMGSYEHIETTKVREGLDIKVEWV